MTIPSSEILIELETSFAAWKETKKDEDGIKFHEIVLKALKEPSSDLSPFLCKVLDEHNTKLVNEDIIETIEACNNQTAVPSLIRAMQWEPEEDEFGDITLKAIWALQKLNTPEGNAAIKKYIEDTPYPRIKEMFQKR